MILNEIWITQEDFEDDDPEGIVLGTGEFAAWAMDECLLNEGDFPGQALEVYWADRYASEVFNGGHKQFARNTGLHEEAMRNCEAGLEAMGATEALQDFRAFKEIVANRAVADELISHGDYTNQPQAIRSLRGPDIFEFRELCATWIRSLPNLRKLPEEELEAEKARFKELALRNTRGPSGDRNTH